MMVGANREAVIKNIKECAESGRFHDKVEVNDPVLDDAGKKAITDAFVANRTSLGFKAKTKIALAYADRMTAKINRTTRISGAEKIPENLGGAIITSNHFSPLENTVVRHLAHSLGRRDLSIVAQVTPITSESCSCVMPFLILLALMFSPIEIFMIYLRKMFLIIKPGPAFNYIVAQISALYRHRYDYIF